MNKLDDMPGLVCETTRIQNKVNNGCYVDSASSGDECDYEDVDQDESDFVNRRVKGLFSEEMFDNMKDMLTYEANQNGFNLVEVVAKFDMDMIEYIKMINFIRKEVNTSLIFVNSNSFLFQFTYL